MEDENVNLSPALPSFERAADEMTTLTGMLEFYRAVLARKASGLDAGQLATTLGGSDLTIGGLIYHMALVEDSWFYDRFEGNEEPEPWISMDWEADRDWELHNAHVLTPRELLAQYNLSVSRSRSVVAGTESLDQLAAKTREDGGQWNLRWIMVHMIEEYARHAGHADLIRESIDGVVHD